MIQFAHKGILWFLFAMLLMLVGYLLYWRHRKRSLARLGDSELMDSSCQMHPRSAHHWKFITALHGNHPADHCRIGSKGWIKT